GPRVPGGVDAGAAAERCHLDAGVVGDRRLTGGRAEGLGFEPGVGLERPGGLVDVGHVGRSREEVEPGEGVGDLAGLVGVGSGENKPHPRGDGGVVRASFWASRIWAMPCSARPRRSSSSTLVKGMPSAVPWTSTKRPSEVITTFMSTSARTSSE